MNPDNVTGIYFTLTQNEGVVDPTALKLYKGDTQLSATVETDGTGYKFVLNEAPVSGTTTFTIKGDILSTASAGAKVQVDISKVTTASITSGITPFSAGTSVVVTAPAKKVLQPQFGKQTILVSAERRFLSTIHGGLRISSTITVITLSRLWFSNLQKQASLFRLRLNS